MYYYLCAGDWHKHALHAFTLTSQQPYEIGIVIATTSQMRKMSHREVK